MFIDHKLGSTPQEHWLRFSAKAPPPVPGVPGAEMDIVVVSGYKPYPDSLIKGSGKSDSTGASYECHILVGPEWTDLRTVSPIATVSEFSHFNADDAEDTGWGVDACKWALDEVPPTTFGAQIRLKVFLHARGGPDFSVRGIAYHLVAKGRVKEDQEQDFEDHRQL